MRILFVSFFYDPEPNDIKIHTLARELVTRGHKVTSITTFPNYPVGRIYPGYKQRIWTHEDKDGVHVIRLPIYPDHSRSGVKRAISYLSFMLIVCLLGPLLSGKVDVLWVYQPPLTTGFAGHWISLLRHAPLVYEIQDMWPETLTATGMLSNKRILGLLDKLAKFIYHRASAITVASQGLKRNLLDKGVASDKIHVIPDWAQEAIYKPVTKDIEIGKVFHLTDRFNVIFAGNLGPAQALDTMITAASMLHTLPNIQFVIIGDGLDLPALKTKVQEYQLTNVRFIDRQPPTKMADFFAWAGVLLIHLRNDPLFTITVPAKTISYMACGKPILCAVAGDSAEVVRNAGAGLICPPENPQEMAKAIEIMYAMSDAQREAMGQAGRQAFLEHYTCQKLATCYEDVFKNLVEPA
jgi:colanic acid biosynthesis glycosyl transferase WcaI